jgi:hypothetical protein
VDFWDFVLTVVLTVLLPVLVAAVVTYLLNRKFETERRKRLVLSDFVAFRNAITLEGGTEYDKENFFPVMNRIIIEFDDNNINSLLRNFRTEEDSKEKDAILTDIINAMIKKVGIKNLKEEDELIKHPFRPNS